MTIVTKDTLDGVLEYLEKEDNYSLDLETTGLNPYLGAKYFSMIISTATQNFYFNFRDFADHLGNFDPEDTILDREEVPRIIKAIDKRESFIFIHNAKFDLKFFLVEKLGVKNACIWCTQAMGRLVNNLLPSYSLAALGSLIGFEKDDSVEKYITKHKLFKDIDVGKKRAFRDRYYYLVPFDIISKYGLQDGRVCYELGIYEQKRLREMTLQQEAQGLPALRLTELNELYLTPVLLEMEHIGIKIDEAYTREAYEYQLEQVNDAEAKFYALTGIEFEDRNKVLIEAFKNKGLDYGVTTKGNASFSDANLPDNVLGQTIRDYRKAYKLSGTYYRNFLDLADKDGVIHCNFRQSGTSTGRFSCSEPNLQNVPKRGEDTNKYPVRSCFIPRKDYFFVMIDYDQMEYRLLLDLAGEESLIAKIKSGLCVHTATGEEMDVERFAAKTLNFMLLYGGGAQKLADALGTTLNDAKAKKGKYFSTLKKVKRLVNALIKTVERRGFIVNPFGRRLLNPQEGSYKIPNHFIQGGCGDIVKKAMVNLARFLEDKKSRMLLQIHDEILYEVHKDEIHIVEELASIMQNAYEHISLPLTVGIEYSFKNWHEKETFNYEEVMAKAKEHF